MRKKEELILIDGADQTAAVASVSFDGSTCRVVRQNDTKVHVYPASRVQVLPLQKKINPKNRIVTAENQILNDVLSIQDYGSCWKVETGRGSRIYPRPDLTVEEDCLRKKRTADRLHYFSSIASAISLQTPEGFRILEHSYHKITSLPSGTVLASFLDSRPAAAERTPPGLLIYPFGMNQSQKKAVENAFSSQISLVQGPPGTGKTQTILTIIANAVLNNQTVAMVSGNNSATRNVAEKLHKQKLDFLTAALGSRSNQEEFLKNQTGKYPSMRGWKLSEGETEPLRRKIRERTAEIHRHLSEQNRIAEINRELLELEPEIREFDAYAHTAPELSRPNMLFLSSEKVLELLNEYEAAIRSGTRPGLDRKLLFFFRYSRRSVRLLREQPEAVLSFLQSEFYRLRVQELKQEKKLLEVNLSFFSFSEAFAELTDGSLRLLKDCLARRYHGSKPRQVFEPEDLTRRSMEFTREYPVVLSTAYSVKGCLDKDFRYDYLIVDEASQVDLATGVLAMSCARNLVIVGDQKQLPNVLTAEDAAKTEALWDPHLGNAYCFTRQSLLSSAAAVWKEAPAVLLREHYRCHPKIIGFCNQAFYDGQLLVMTEDHGEDEPLSLIRTAGVYSDEGRVNQKEAELICGEVLPALQKRGFRDVGVITPYRDQVELLQKMLPDSAEIDTVHRFQGREKDAIVLTSVDQKIGAFADDPHMLNVAVSRAVKSLTVVTSSDPRNNRTHYGDLVRYISYYSGQIQNSAVYPVSDRFCREVTGQRRTCLMKHRQSAECENRFDACIRQVLQDREFEQLDWASHVRLCSLVRDRTRLTEQERAYLADPRICLDYVIFHRMDKLPVLAVETDGMQSFREREMDHILQVVRLPLLRIRTDSEVRKLEHALRTALSWEAGV